MAIKRKKGEEKLYRQYPLKHNMTQTKRQVILTLLQKYRQISAIIQSDIIKEYQKTGYINKYIAYKDLPSYDNIYRILPKAVYIQMALTQVIEMLLSRESNIQNTITVFIEKLESKRYTSDIKHMLHILNNQSRTKLATSKMVFGDDKGIREHLDIINANRVKNSLHKSIVSYRKELQLISNKHKSGLITNEEQIEETELLTEQYQNKQRKDIRELQFVSYNNKNIVINKEKDGEGCKIIIPVSIYTLYKQIYRHVTKKWKYPSCKNIAMRIDSRCVTLENPVQAFQSGKLLYWLKLKLISSVDQDNGKKKFDINVPLLRNEYFLSKKGVLANAVFIGLDNYGELFIRIMKNMTESIKKNKRDYQHMVQMKYGNSLKPCNDNGRILALDFGLRVMFTDQYGNQYGKDWFSVVRDYDSLIQDRMRHLQKTQQNPKLSEDAVYVGLIRKCRNYIKNEVNRVISYIVKNRNPYKLVLENIKFVNPELSREMNRLVKNCGRQAISSKLESIKEEYGVSVEYVNPAYTSQLCNGCGMVHSESRKGDRYECIECGSKLNADVNAARNILMRYLMNNYSVHSFALQNLSLTDKDTMEPCSIVLTMSKYSVFNTVTDFSFLKMRNLMKERFLKSINAQEPMTGNRLKTG